MSYRKGYRLENRAQHIFEKHGYLVLRSPASKSPLDLVAIGRKRFFFIQCKATSRKSLYVYGLASLRQLAAQYGAKPLLVYSMYYTPIYVTEVRTDNIVLHRGDTHTPLDLYLEGLDGRRHIGR